MPNRRPLPETAMKRTKEYRGARDARWTTTPAFLDVSSIETLLVAFAFILLCPVLKRKAGHSRAQTRQMSGDFG